MKSKFTVKMLGTLVALAMLASLIVGITASPASAAAGTLAWGTYTTPSNAGYLLGGYSNLLSPAAPIGDPTINMVAASPTGSEIFGLDAANETLYSSTNGGASWSEVAATGITGTVVDFKVSPNFKTDSALAIATTTGVWISTNAGASFTNISPNLTGGEIITSMAIGYWFNTSNVLTVLVGLNGTATGNYDSNVIDYTYGAFGWTAVKNATGATAGPQLNNVYGVAFSPAAITDGEIMAVYENTGALYISSDFGTLGWNSSAYPDNAIIGAAGTPVTAALTAINYVKIATASDYVANTGASIFVGTNGATTTVNVDDVYRVSGRANGPGSAVAEALDKSVTSLAVSGPIATATVLAGYIGGLSYTTTATASPPSWSGSSGLGGISVVNPGPGVSIAVAGSMVVAGTQGTDGGIYVSSNLGASFQGVGALTTGNAAVLPVKLVSFTPASATTWFVTMANTDGEEYVFVTTNGGTSWMRIYAESPVAPATSVNLMVSASKAYATDSTVVISDGSSLLHESTNGGISFSSVGSAATTVSSIFVINASNIFVGTTGGTYKVGSFAQGATDGTAVTSFALSPMDKTLATFLVGQSDGTVWQTTNNGGTFTEIGAAPGSVSLGNPVTYVAYGPDGTIYAAEGTGVFSWSATAAAWSNLGQTLVSAMGLAVASNNVLYVMDSTAANLVYRTVNPNQENTAAGGAPTFNSMNFGTVSNTPGTDVLTSMAVLSAQTGDTVLVMDTTGPTALLNGNGVAGCLEGFVDTMAVAPTKLVPANNAVVNLPGTTMNVTLSWAAVTGATSYDVVVNGSVVTVAGQSFTTDTNSYTLTVNYGSAYTWSVYPYSVVAIPAGNQPAPFLGLSSPTQNFTTALAPIIVTPIPFNPAQGASNVPLSNFTFTWPADQTDINAGLTVTYQFAIAQASANTSANEFAILDYSDNTATNAETLQETLQPNAVYWWEVRSVAMNGTGGVATYGAWAVSTFTTGPAMTSTTVAPPVTVTQTNVTITQTQPPATTVQSTVTSLVVTQAAATQAIPAYLLWIVIVIGAILVIAVIVLIVRTRRIP